MQTIVEVNSIEKSYGLMQVINHCSFKIYQEEIYGLLGINGAGKTTLMKKLTNEGTSILLSSHIIGDVRHTADRIGILSGGRIKQEFFVEEKVSECGEHFEDYVIDLMRRE